MIKSVAYEDLISFINDNKKEIKKNVMSFSDKNNYIAFYEDNKIVGVVGWIEYKESVKLKNDFVLPNYRKKGIYKTLNEIRFSLLPKGKTIYANCTQSSIHLHLKNGAKIITTYKHPSYKIKYNPL